MYDTRCRHFQIAHFSPGAGTESAIGIAHALASVEEKEVESTVAYNYRYGN